MCQRNWSQYNANLVQRGSLSFFCHPSIIKLIKKNQKNHHQCGRPPYPSQMIIAGFLTYRRCQGMAFWLLSPHGIVVPSYSTICRGIQRLSEKLTRKDQKSLSLILQGLKLQEKVFEIDFIEFIDVVEYSLQLFKFFCSMFIFFVFSLRQLIFFNSIKFTTHVHINI